ncbi:MAG: phosphatidylserine decarboxylase family protein [Ignavibacteria bacterium]|nr:phosphatidylserine decarboxylase family protein [Ignavibacteria bacterium]
MIRLTVYGRDVIIKALLLTLIIDIIALLIPNETLKILLLVISAFFIVFTLYFFRDPVREVPADLKEGAILSPADGKVMIIEEIKHNSFTDSKALVIGIFLSPLNVHVNRIPASGEITEVKYIKGEFIAAFEASSSHRNERTEITLDTGKFKIIFSQIAGFVARRIVCELKKGDKVKAGNTFGMIKFGSRMDVIMPVNSECKVSLNQKVKAGETVIAEVKLD